MCVVSVLLIVLILGIIAYSENIKSLEIIENMKRALEEITQSSNTVAQSNVTTIDVTGIVLGKETQHEHIYKTMYDETKHWEECTVCSEHTTIRNEKTHTLITTWASGVESCHFNNSYTKTCECGYSEIGHKPCVWDGKTYYINKQKCIHGRLCSICNHHILYSYYIGSYGNGKIYDVPLEKEPLLAEYPTLENCYMSNGQRLTCLTSGTCSVCNTVHTSQNPTHSLVGENGKIYCRVCKKEFGTISMAIQNDSNVPVTYSITMSMKFINGATIYSTGGLFDSSEVLEINNPQLVSINSDNTEVTITTTAKLKSTYKEKLYDTCVCGYVEINGVRSEYQTEFFDISPDLTKPLIDSILISNDNSMVEWSKSKPIIISGTENYCNTVKVEILDDEGGTVFFGKTTVNNGKYTISCTPNIESGLEGRNFKVIVTDACDNSTEKEFTILKIDSIPPEVTSDDKISEGWAKEKNFIFTATDQGIGNVQIAFNDVADYELASKNGTEYSREYKLVGDVYLPREANVYYKDELGNVSTKKVIIDKLDNTSPTITGASFSNNRLNITAHDRHETEGEGSGVSKYRFITSTTKLESPEVTTGNSTEVLVNEDMIIPDIYKVKYVYVIAEDVVGNISNVYEVEVPQLKLTSKVNLSGNNGKGVVELDWSSYDSANKYFVIYRKEKDSTDWNKIENKLTGNKYTDNLGNDKEVPTVPSVSIVGNSAINSIGITVDAQDNGSNYMYYVEAYDVNTSGLLSVSE